MTTLPITSILVALACAGLVALSLPISMKRAKLPAGVVDDENLRRQVRAQGNFIEYVPLGLLALGLIEFSGAEAGLVWGLGGTFAAARVLHALGMLASMRMAVAAGALLNYLTLLALAVFLAFAVYA